MRDSIYLSKDTTRYEFITLRGNHLIIKDTLVTTDKYGRRLSKDTTCGGSYWCPVNIYSDERMNLSDRYWKATKVSKDTGNELYKDLRSIGYRRVRENYKPF